MCPEQLNPVAYVEDVPEDAARFVEQFKAAGFSNPVVLFDTGEMLMNVFGVVRFELILVDLTLVSAIDNVRLMQGNEIVRALREVDTQVPIIAVTRSNDEVVKRSVRKSGADGIVSKPFDVKDLMARLAEAGIAANLEHRADTGSAV